MSEEEVKDVKDVKDLALDDPRRVACEAVRRKYVKRTGGLRKGLSAEETAEAKRACKEYGLSPDNGWDKYVTIGSMGEWN